MYLKPATWSKGCGWNQSKFAGLLPFFEFSFCGTCLYLIVDFCYSPISSEDDARLLLGIHYHGFGNWEKIRLDEKLGLAKKIAPVELQHHETFLPRAPQLKERASQLLEMVQFLQQLLFALLVTEMV